MQDSKTNKSTKILDEFALREGESLGSLRVIASFSGKGRRKRIVERECQSDSTALTSLFHLLIETDNLSLVSLRSLLSKGRSGRRAVEVDRKTGTIRHMKSPNKEYVEGWNKGNDVEQIAGFVHKKLNPKRKSAVITKIRRILRTNQNLLIRPYRQKTKKKTRH